MVAFDGKMRETDTADTEQILQLMLEYGILAEKITKAWAFKELKKENLRDNMLFKYSYIKTLMARLR